MERDLPQEAAERLLSGDLTPPPEGAESLAALLAAAAAPARPDELAGEAAAMAAFRAHPPTVRRRSLRSVLTIKVLAIVAATVAAGGVALASGTGLLPNPFQPSPGTSQSPTGSSSPKDRSPVPDPTSSGKEHPKPDEVLIGLCHLYQAKPSGERGKALQTPAFEALVLKAGGADHVEAFCAQLPPPEDPAAEKTKEPAGPGKPPTPGPPTPAPRATPSRANAQ